MFFFPVRLRTSESENINKSSQPMVVENTPIVVRPKKQEEKWTSVSSKKTSKASKVNEYFQIFMTFLFKL